MPVGQNLQTSKWKKKKKKAGGETQYFKQTYLLGPLTNHAK